MIPRQARRERREAERKAKKLQLKKSRLAEKHPLAAVDEFPEIQPRWNPELEDEFPKEVQIRNNAIADRMALKVGLPIPPPGPSLTFRSVDDLREQLLARRKAAEKSDPPVETEDIDFVSEMPDPPSDPTPDNDAGFVSQRKPSRAEINRDNAQFSTGPTSIAGKLASCGNSLKHGLASGQIIIPGEDRTAFDLLLNDLLAEHQPATTTEELLVQEMAQSHWLTQRAIRYQNGCFGEEGADQKQLALFLRYQTTHQRSFYNALNTLLKLKKANPQTKIGFVSQPHSTAAPKIGFVSHDAASTAHEIGFVSQKTGKDIHGEEFARQNSAGQGRAPQQGNKRPKPSKHKMWREAKQPNCAYSCADICWSESRQALIFKRRHTQHRSSASWGPVSGVHDPPHTPHCWADIGRSGSMDFFAISKISGETMGSALIFFFILVSL